MTNAEKIAFISKWATALIGDGIPIELHSLDCIDNVDLDRLVEAVKKSAARNKNDITIAWGDRDHYNRHKVALGVQDAGNLRALAREFVKVVDQAADETGSTKATWDDAAVVLFINKFESLCRSDARFSEVYRACENRGGVQ